jgi:hypothetical protein
MVTAIHGGWRPCRDGELRQFVEGLSVRRRLRLAWAASCLTALALGSGVMATEAAARMFVASGSEGWQPGKCVITPHVSPPTPRTSLTSTSIP